MGSKICEKLRVLVLENPKIKNFKFFKEANPEHGHGLTRSLVGEFFRNIAKGDEFYDTYEYVAKKGSATLRVVDREGFLEFMEESKKMQETKEEIENIIETKQTKAKNYNTEFKFPYKALNILLYNNSKENNYIDKSRNYLVKSRLPFYVNGRRVEMQDGLLDLMSYSFFSNEKLQLTFKGTVVLIENKESYDFAESVFDQGDYLFILYGGNASDKEQEFITRNVHCDRMVYFGDFDYISLKEYNRLKTKNKNVELFYGGDLKELESRIEKYGNENIFIDQEGNPEYVLKHFDETSKLIWRLIVKHEKALEQEIFHAPDL